MLILFEIALAAIGYQLARYVPAEMRLWAIVVAMAVMPFLQYLNPLPLGFPLFVIVYLLIGVFAYALHRPEPPANGTNNGSKKAGTYTFKA